MPEKILIDTDPGVDDAMAILLALRSQELEVVGLTTVFGNAEVDTCALNGRRLVELEGYNHIPVARGAGKALVRTPHPSPHHIHGADGMGGINPPLPVGEVVEVHAAQFIVETILANPGEITLVPVGPLTNIALAVRLEPRIVDRVKKVVIMGGAAFVPGNASPVAEANIWNDPEAASIVFGAGWDLTMVGLDVTEKVVMTPDYLAGLAKAGNPATDLITRILPCYQQFHDDVYGMQGAIHTHDPSAIMYLIDPSLFQTVQIPVYVETQGRCAGQTVPDMRRQWIDGPLTRVCVEVEAGRFLGMYKDRIMMNA